MQLFGASAPLLYWPEGCSRRRQSLAWWQTDSRWTHPTTASALWTLAAAQRIAGIPSQESWCLRGKMEEFTHVTLEPHNGILKQSEGPNNGCDIWDRFNRSFDLMETWGEFCTLPNATVIYACINCEFMRHHFRNNETRTLRSLRKRVIFTIDRSLSSSVFDWNAHWAAVRCLICF